jgi:hypothetical protein
MSTKLITIFASTIAVLATLTVAQAAASKTGMNHPAATRQDGSFQVAQSVWWEPRRPPAACACVRG